MSNFSLFARLFIVILVVAVAATFATDSAAQAQPWSGIIDPSRAIDWSKAGVPGGIPPQSSRTQCGSTIPPTTDASVIQNALNACGANQYVLLGAGTFNLNGSIVIRNNNVTLRGSGPNLTILNFSVANYCGILNGLVCIQGQSRVWTGGGDGAWSTNWTAGYAQGTTQITVGSTSNTAAGRIIFLDQLDDQSDNGGIINGSRKGVLGGEGLPSFGRCLSSESCDNANGINVRTQYHIHRVVSVDDATHLTITPPIQMPNWRSSQKPQMYGIGTSETDFVSGVGLENLTLHNSGLANNGQNSIVEFANAYGSWAKNVRTINGLRDHFTSHQSAHIEIRDSYLYGAVTSNSQSYAIESQGASDNLYINNIIHYTTVGFLGPCPGCVFAYNYGFAMHYIDGRNCVDNASLYSTCNFMVNANAHDSGGGKDLWEGNDSGSGMSTDLNHGTSPLATFFRNRLGGYDDDGATLNYRFAAELQSFARGVNFIGNVLGVPGVHNIYEASTPFADLIIFNLGSNSYGLPNDSIVKSSSMRWGNYDTVNGVVRWNPSEVPTTGIPFINGNPVPANQNLPNSFFLASQPTSWWATPWGTPGWPPIGPDVTGGTGTYGGRVYDIPAKLCFKNVGNDTRNYPGTTPPILAFDANNCYRSSGSSGTTPPIVTLTIQ